MKIRRKCESMSNYYYKAQSKTHIRAKFTFKAGGINNIAYFIEEVFQKKLDHFKKERQRVLRKGIPLSENLQKIN